MTHDLLSVLYMETWIVSTVSNMSCNSDTNIVTFHRATIGLEGILTSPFPFPSLFQTLEDSALISNGQISS